MGCVVAFLHDLHNIVNVVAVLSRSDIAYLAHVGGALAPINSNRVFVSDMYNIISNENADIQIRQLLGKKLPIMVAALPREMDKMRTAEKWSQYFRSKMGKADWESLCKFCVEGTISPITFPGQFFDERPTFEQPPDYQQPCEESAEQDDHARVMAQVVKAEFDRQFALSNSASSNVAPSSSSSTPNDCRRSPFEYKSSTWASVRK